MAKKYHHHCENDDSASFGALWCQSQSNNHGLELSKKLCMAQCESHAEFEGEVNSPMLKGALEATVEQYWLTF